LAVYDKARIQLDKYKRFSIILIEDFGTLRPEDMKCVDCIFHLAAVSGVKKCEEDNHTAYENNVEKTKKLVDLAVECGVKKIIFTSSAAVYGRFQECKEEMTHLEPMNFYAGTKLKGEKIILEKEGIQGIVVRLSNVYGYGFYDKNTVVSKFINDGMYKSHLTLYGSGRQARDFIHIDDVCGALMYLANNYKENKGLFNIGKGASISIKKAGKMVIKELAKINISYRNLTINHKKTERIEPQMGYKFSIKKIKKIGWKPQISFKRGLKKLVKRKYLLEKK